MTRPAPILIGFFPKRTARPDSWFAGTSIEEICSVSQCISPGPDDDNWVDRWEHNLEWWLFDTEAAAWSIVGEDAASYDMYAYKVFPVVFDGAAVRPIAVEATAQGDLSEFDFLGYDPVSRDMYTPHEFGHSPLSCNKGCEQFPVNRHCLLDDLEVAWQATCRIARDAKEKESWEPGVYYLCEVHRKRKPAKSAR